MPTYVCLMNFTTDGIQSVKDHPKRREETKKAVESMGQGYKVHHVYLTLGPYDLCVIIDCPGDEAAATFALASSMRGKISTLTMRAFDEGEADKLIHSLP
jgi:uncharacterized protein with GYD domain